MIICDSSPPLLPSSLPLDTTMVYVIFNGKQLNNTSIRDIVNDKDINNYIANYKKKIMDIYSTNTPTNIPVFVESEIIEVEGIEYHLIRALLIKSKHDIGEPCVIINDLYYRWFNLWSSST